MKVRATFTCSVPMAQQIVDAADDRCQTDGERMNFFYDNEDASAFMRRTANTYAKRLDDMARKCGLKPKADETSFGATMSCVSGIGGWHVDVQRYYVSG